MPKKKLNHSEIHLDDLRIHVSGEFLTNNLPNNFAEMPGSELDIFLTDYAWQPFENDSPTDIWEWIDDAALALKAFLESRGIEVKGD